MFSKLLLAALTAASLSSAMPLEKRVSTLPLDKRASMTPAALENSVLDTAVAYQSIEDHALFLGQIPGIGAAVVGDYRQTVNSAMVLPEPSGHPYAPAIQLTLCESETTATLQQLETHAILRQYVSDFTAKEKNQLLKVIKKDRTANAAYGTTFARYVPVCGESVLHNMRLTQESYRVTMQIFSGAYD